MVGSAREQQFDWMIDWQFQVGGKTVPYCAFKSNLSDSRRRHDYFHVVRIRSLHHVVGGPDLIFA